MSTMVICKGVLCHITGISSFEMIVGPEDEKDKVILFEVTATESAQPFSHSSVRMVHRTAFMFLPSTIEFSDSEWFQGVKNASAK